MSNPVSLEYKIVDPSEIGLVVVEKTPQRGVLVSANTVLSKLPGIQGLFTGPWAISPNKLNYLLIDKSVGLDVPSLQPNVGGTLSIANGVAEIKKGCQIQANTTVAAQGPFILIWEGKIVWPSQSEKTTVWRCAYCVLSNGKILWAIGHGGMYAFAEKILKNTYDGATVVSAIYPDGGKSSLLFDIITGKKTGYPGDNPQIFVWWIARNPNAPVLSLGEVLKQK